MVDGKSNGNGFRGGKRKRYSWFCFSGDFFYVWPYLFGPLGDDVLFFLGFLSKSKNTYFKLKPSLMSWQENVTPQYWRKPRLPLVVGKKHQVRTSRGFATGMDSYAELLHRNPALKPMLERGVQDQSRCFWQ